MGDITYLHETTEDDIPPERVLDNAPEMESVILIGREVDGTAYFASSSGDAPEILWLIEWAKRQLFESCGEP